MLQGRETETLRAVEVLSWKIWVLVHVLFALQDDTDRGGPQFRLVTRVTHPVSNLLFWQHLRVLPLNEEGKIRSCPRDNCCGTAAAVNSPRIRKRERREKADK